jgi:uncharacterized membrane protein
MHHVVKSTVINARAEKIFDIINDPNRAHEMNPDLTILTHNAATEGGYNSTWEYKMAGRKFNGESHVIEYEAPQHLVFETSGGIPSRWEWRLDVQDPITTEVSLSVEYTVPGSIIGAVVNKLVVERQNEKSIENQLHNLKHMAEHN